MTLRNLILEWFIRVAERWPNYNKIYILIIYCLYININIRENKNKNIRNKIYIFFVNNAIISNKLWFFLSVNELFNSFYLFLDNNANNNN